MIRRYVPILLTLLCATLTAADSLVTLQLRNRPAVEVVPVIEPLLEPGDKISGQGFKIFLRAAPQTIFEIRELVAQIDVAAKTLMISVFQGQRSDLAKREISGSLRVDEGGVSGSLGAKEVQRSESSGPVHRLRVAEGSEGFIATGTSRGLFSATQVEAASGFYVLPRLNGDRVTLQISPFRNEAKDPGGNIDTLQATTTIGGRLGEWLPLGGVSERIERSGGDGISQRSMKSYRRSSIWIRADLIR